MLLAVKVSKPTVTSEVPFALAARVIGIVCATPNTNEILFDVSLL
jgi:hypothetical protein